MTQTTLETQVSQAATAIGAYTKVIDTFVKIAREGIAIPPDAKEISVEAWGGLSHEVRYLRFLREEAQKASVDDS